MEAQSLESLVHEALDNAKDNGYSVLLGQSPQEIAEDMIEFDATFEEYYIIDDLIPYILSWQSIEGNTP